ncbi:DUF4349 domain-containing protein [Patescibacteria group bacterium]|nr:DUF4349 domain-containing protein [Patescibacteria group bacterium]MBU1256207.1 DUF4349 domain-containing protein [Patescibacteria group bacterium]MBU1457806.1 DUF4349 domain-containing protein [Patescibacteria group bacterium]
MSIVTWVKNNKLSTLLLLILTFFLLNFRGLNYASLDSIGSPKSMGVSSPNYALPVSEYTPQANIEDRMVIQESNLSLQVNDVTDVKNKILSYTKTIAGYMVSSRVSNPQDAPTATVIIRIPSDSLNSALDYLHSLSVKVVSENLSGRDVTDQYMDIDSRLATLQNTKERFESILSQATLIQDITNLTREILNIQNQIDPLKGQQQSLKQNTQLSKLTIYLSTDEFALPYAPSETFRPNVIFKLAVRSLIGFLRGLASYAIWIGVYSIVWLPILAIFIAIKRSKKRKQSTSNFQT